MGDKRPPKSGVPKKAGQRGPPPTADVRRKVKDGGDDASYCWPIPARSQPRPGVRPISSLWKPCIELHKPIVDLVGVVAWLLASADDLDRLGHELALVLDGVLQRLQLRERELQMFNVAQADGAPRRFFEAPQTIHGGQPHTRRAKQQL